jgi:hypothetical protein
LYAPSGQKSGLPKDVGESQAFLNAFIGMIDDRTITHVYFAGQQAASPNNPTDRIYPLLIRLKGACLGNSQILQLILDPGSQRLR